MDKLDRMKQLVEQINKYNKYYYTFDAPLVSDSEWDKLYDELEALEKELNIKLENSPTNKVGDEILKGFKKVKHPKKLYSMDKRRDINDLVDWINDQQNKYGVNSFALEYKFDGLRIVLTYENGELKLGATRGNGVVGEDVTKQIETIKTLPKTIPYKGHVVVMGEAMIKKSVLEKYNLSSNEPLKNERNAAAGAIRNLDINIARNRNLDLFLYDILEIDSKEFNTQEGMHQFLKDNGFCTFDFFKILHNSNDIINEINEIDKNKSKLDILIDGAVIKVNDLFVRDKIGYTNKFPKWAVAFKFKAEEATSKILNIVWQVGRTGKITPIAEIEPTELAGATVKRATLNNYGDIIRKQVKINSNVFVRRSNEVIPEILGLAFDNPNSIEIEKPVFCPSCGAKLIEDGANLFCTNKNNCVEQINERINHFCSRNAMNIEGVSEKTISQFRENLKISNVADIYDIEKEELLKLDNFKDKKADNLISSIEKSKSPNFSNFIFALGINGVGDKTAQDLAKTFKTFEDLKNASIEQLIEIDEVGEVIGKNIFEYFKNPYNLEIISRLFTAGIKIQYNKIEEKFNPNLSGKTIVLTGVLDNYSRDEATKILQGYGAKVSGSVSKQTDLVLVGSSGAGSKLKKAKELGIKIITENEFEKFL